MPLIVITFTSGKHRQYFQSVETPTYIRYQGYPYTVSFQPWNMPDKCSLHFWYEALIKYLSTFNVRIMLHQLIFIAIKLFHAFCLPFNYNTISSENITMMYVLCNKRRYCIAIVSSKKL